MPTNQLEIFSALWNSTVQIVKCYVSRVQILVNSIELRRRPSGEQSAGDTTNCLWIINTSTTCSYHRQIALRSCPKFQATSRTHTLACVLVPTDRQTDAD